MTWHCPEKRRSIDELRDKIAQLLDQDGIEFLADALTNVIDLTEDYSKPISHKRVRDAIAEAIL